MNWEYTIRVMSPADMEQAVEWAAREGWNPGLDDARIFHSTDPLGFCGGYLDGELVASISVVSYGADFAFVGFYIVRPEYRGQGYGLKLWQTALSRRPARLMALDGVVRQQASYQKSGFVRAYANIRYGGVVEGVLFPGLVALGDLPFEEILSCDRRFFPAERSGFLSQWIDPAHGKAFGVVRDGKLCGMGVIRECRQGFKIGPLYAETEEIAETLFLALAAHANGATVFLDVPAPNAAATRLAERLGLTPSFETARMYTGAQPEIAMSELFGVTTFELG